MNALTRGPKEPAISGLEFMTLMHGVSQPDDIETQIELEYWRQVYRQAAEIVRDAIQKQTWRIFLMTIIEGQSTDSVAKQMNTTIGNVHAIRSRVMRRLQIAAMLGCTLSNPTLRCYDITKSLPHNRNQPLRRPPAINDETQLPLGELWKPPNANIEDWNDNLTPVLRDIEESLQAITN